MPSPPVSVGIDPTLVWVQAKPVHGGGDDGGSPCPGRSRQAVAQRGKAGGAHLACCPSPCLWAPSRVHSSGSRALDVSGRSGRCCSLPPGSERASESRAAARRLGSRYFVTVMFSSTIKPTLGLIHGFQQVLGEGG